MAARRLVWGDLVYVPFLYSLVGWFLVDAGVHGEAFGALRLGTSLPYVVGLVVYLSFALCAGFDSPWPYSLPLSHRAFHLLR